LIVQTSKFTIYDLRFTKRAEFFSPRVNRKSPIVNNDGSILVGLLWCVVLLSLLVVGVLHTARMDLMVQKNYGDRIQARYLALAGVEKAKALLYKNARERSRNGKNHDGELYDSPQQFREMAFGRGTFSVLRRARSDEGNDVAYGVSDEESRLNVNTASAEQLAKLKGLTPEIATAILGWRGGGQTAVAEAEYYASLQPSSQPRNAPFETGRELLMVRGISPELLLGQDVHQNGMTEISDDATSDATRFENVSSDEILGWAGVLTVDSAVKEVNAAGEARVNIQSADENKLAGVHGITSDIARAITAYRGKNRFQSIADLLDVTPAQNNSSSRQSGANQDASSGPKVISENLFMDLADDVTVNDGDTLTGAININTAGLTVLCCLPDVDRNLAQAIISYRQSNGYFKSIGELLKVDGLNRQIFKGLAPLVTARSETFRILCEGRIKSTGTRQRVQVIVRVGLDDVKTLSYREDDL
jgi:competence protein ComEA